MGFDRAGLFRTPTGRDGSADLGALSREIPCTAEHQLSLTASGALEDEQMIVNGGVTMGGLVAVNDELEIGAQPSELEHPFAIGLNAHLRIVSLRARIAYRL